MTWEQELADALHVADRYEPSPDLFEKVQQSIAEDAAHRRRVRLTVAAVLGVVTAITVVLSLTANVVDGRLEVPFAVVEWLATGVMLAVVLVIGPSIRRFGSWFEQEAFRSSRETGARFLRLLDLAYYLVFVGYVVVTLQFEPAAAWGPPDEARAWLAGQVERLAGLLLLMGVLHVLLVMSIPVVGLVASANVWRSGDPDRMANSGAAAVDRAISVVVGVLVAVAMLGLAVLVITLVLVGLSGP